MNSFLFFWGSRKESETRETTSKLHVPPTGKRDGHFSTGGLAFSREAILARAPVFLSRCYHF